MYKKFLLRKKAIILIDFIEYEDYIKQIQKSFEAYNNENRNSY